MKKTVRTLSFFLLPVFFYLTLTQATHMSVSESKWRSKHGHISSEKLRAWLNAQPIKTIYLNSDDQWVLGPEFSQEQHRKIRLKKSNYPLIQEALSSSEPNILKICSYSSYKIKELQETLKPMQKNMVLLFCRADVYHEFLSPDWFKEVSHHNLMAWHILHFLNIGQLMDLSGDFIFLDKHEFLTDEAKNNLIQRGHLLL